MSGLTPQQIAKAKDRFWKHTVPARQGDCVLWTGSLDGHGYGHLTFESAPRKAHRLAYEAFVGPIPDGMHLDHVCRVRNCVNPQHLEPVTNRENTRRGNAGKAAGARRRAKTHCPSGHPYSGENLYIDKNGKRSCQECRRKHVRAWNAKSGGRP